MEFRSSPQLDPEEEIRHYTHSSHPLRRVSLGELFECSGCKEYGAGSRFACQECNFQLHEFCLFSPPILKDHPLHGQHQLLFYSKTKPAGLAWAKCDICGKSAKGFTFGCRACSFQMHPCCALFSTEINLTAHPHLLRLQPPIQNAVTACEQCQQRRPGSRVYHCTACEYQLHAVCAKAFMNGLQANGIPTPANPSALATAARLASQVVIKFIGGLIEGLGESVGDVIVQSMARGRYTSTRRRTR